MNPFLSRKIRNLTFFSIVMVLWIHAFNSWPRYLTPFSTIQEGINFSSFTQFFLSNGILRFVIPLLFLMSGFLFFFKHREGPLNYKEKLASRTKTLLFPYLLWNVLGTLIFVALTQIPWLQAHAPGWMLEKSPLDHGIGLLFGPVNFSIWFLKDLFVLVLISPLFFSGGKDPLGRWVLSIFFFLIWIADLPLFPLFTSGESPFFFFLGACLAFQGYGREENTQPSKKLFPLLVLLLGTLVLGFFRTALASLPSLGMAETLFAETWIMDLLLLFSYKVLQLLSLLLVWKGYDLLISPKAHGPKMSWLISSGFFIFVAHQPLMELFSDNILTRLGHSQETPLAPEISLAFYLVYPIVVGGVLIGINNLLRHIFPRTHAFLTGNRGKIIGS